MHRKSMKQIERETTIQSTVEVTAIFFAIALFLIAFGAAAVGNMLLLSTAFIGMIACGTVAALIQQRMWQA
jgi:hypothetical protein